MLSGCQQGLFHNELLTDRRRYGSEQDEPRGQSRSGLGGQGAALREQWQLHLLLEGSPQRQSGEGQIKDESQVP